MNTDWQTWVALGVVAVAAVCLVWSWWRKRGTHEGCDCPGAGNNREWKALKRKLGR